MNHIFLTGFMGAGKSSVGRLVAEALRRPFVDLDVEIERREGATIPELFSSLGEEGFRHAEHEALASRADTEPSVVATGGGVVMREDNRRLLRETGIVVYLAVTPEEAVSRIGGAEGRPLLAGGGVDTARRILAERLPVYEGTADIVVDTDGLAVEEVVARVLGCLRERRLPGAIADRVHVSGNDGGYEILIGPGLLQQAGALIADVWHGGHLAVVSDDRVWPLFGDQLMAALQPTGASISTHIIAAGESSKCWAQAGLLLDELAAAGLDRTSAVVALGGGVVGDLGGFVASSFMRGIPLVHVPTTLLAQVDSAIGGKTGVDLTAGKNLAGAFWPPRLVISDTATLATLPAAEWTNGLVELVKGAFLEGGATLDRVENGLSQLVSREPAAVERGVSDAAAFKAAVVSSDLREADVRECLNFGHTLGHALELIVGYGVLPHGLAVAEGMRFAARLAQELVGAERTLTDRIAEVLERVGAGRETCHALLLPAAARLQPEHVLAAMKADKKSRAGMVRFILLERPCSWLATGVEDAVLLGHLNEWLATL